MKVVSSAAKLNGHIQIPASKSHTIRSLILAAMADGTSCIKNPLKSQDTLSTVAAIKQLGAGFEEKNGDWYVTGWKNPALAPNKTINAGNSGSLMYFLAPVLATYPAVFTFTGDDSICKRPVSHLIQALEQMGIWTDGAVTPPFSFGNSPSAANTAPFKEKFSSPGAKLVTDGALSQYISGFMMAGATLPGGLQLELTNPGETPYLDMTKWWLEKVGAECTISDDYKHIFVRSNSPAENNNLPAARTPLRAFTQTIPSDWESAAFPVAAALITSSHITVDNIDTSGTQGDEAFVPILQSLGADLKLDAAAKTLEVNGDAETGTSTKETGTSPANYSPLRGNITVSLAPIPDAICALASLAAVVDGEIAFTDVDGCRKKETDRVQVMCDVLAGLGARVRQTVGGFAVGKGELRGGEVESYGDHRIAMALSVLGLGLKQGESVIIKNAECCEVSFPHFFEVMNKIGANFEIIN